MTASKDCCYGFLFSRLLPTASHRTNFGSRELKEAYALYQNQPNPFEDATVIGFYLPQAGEATLTDVRGRVLKVLKGDYSRGYQQLTLAGDELPTGVLQYTLTSGAFTATRKMVSVK